MDLSLYAVNSRQTPYTAFPYYRFLQGDPAAVNAFQNDYMQSYSWAEIRNAELDFWEYREPERR